MGTNYTNCLDEEDKDFRTIVNDFYVGRYLVSIVALMLSLFIFLRFRSLRCTRVRIHIHLFTSFILNNILWVVWYSAVVNRFLVVKHNEDWCQILHIFTNYFMVTSYFWMFCEGLHLNIALVVVFIKEDLAMRWFMTIGWGLSFVVIVIYATVRYWTPGATERCWMDDSKTVWIITVPVVTSLLGSTVFLVNVVRIVCSNIRPLPNHRTYTSLGKAARAAFLLIPLFGLHYLLTPLRPLPNAPGENVYQVISAIMMSQQGLCLSVMLCFINDEVAVAIRAYIARFRRLNQDMDQDTSGGKSLANTEDHE